MDMHDILEEEQESKLKKILVMVGSIILIILIISYILVSFPIFSKIASISESNEIQDNTIYLDNFKVTFSKEVYQELQSKYQQSIGLEFASCLIGKKENNNYDIKEIYFPQIIEQSFSHVKFKQCIQETLIVLHSHPSGNCIGSEQDILSLEESKQTNQNSLIMIMCGEKRFTTY